MQVKNGTLEKAGSKAAEDKYTLRFLNTDTMDLAVLELRDVCSWSAFTNMVDAHRKHLPENTVVQCRFDRVSGEIMTYTRLHSHTPSAVARHYLPAWLLPGEKPAPR